jgi:hypothetical protein
LRRGGGGLNLWILFGLFIEQRHLKHSWAQTGFPPRRIP